MCVRGLYISTPQVYSYEPGRSTPLPPLPSPLPPPAGKEEAGQGAGQGAGQVQELSPLQVIEEKKAEEMTTISEEGEQMTRSEFAQEEGEEKRVSILSPVKNPNEFKGSPTVEGGAGEGKKLVEAAIDDHEKKKSEQTVINHTTAPLVQYQGEHQLG